MFSFKTLLTFYSLPTRKKNMALDNQEITISVKRIQEKRFLYAPAYKCKNSE
jgi:hypothetical protein